MPTFLELSCLPPSFLVSVPLAQPATCSPRTLAPLDLSLFPMHYLPPPSGPSATAIPTPHTPIGPSPSYVYPAAAPYYPTPFLQCGTAIPLSAPVLLPTNLLPILSTSSYNVNVTDFVQLSYIQLLVLAAAHAHLPLVHPLPASGHPPRTSPARSVASSNATQSETETEPEPENITRYSVDTPPLSVSSELYYRLLCPRDVSCSAADMFIGQIKALKKILTVDAETEIHAISLSEGALTKLKEALLVGCMIICNAALQHIDLSSKAIGMDDQTSSGNVTKNILHAPSSPTWDRSIRRGEMFSYKDREVEWMGTETDNGLEPAYPEIFGEIH
ncbi:hypothetical protein DFH09DRAFT_1070335 [Mycena vulgaris]|nr:hypothetical protein DFH09DRAFT_1070335 [Mycena vulgaris]